MSGLACSSCGKGTENMRLLKKLTRAELERDKLRHECDELRKVANDAMAEEDKLARDAASMQAENAKLRQQLADVTESMGRVEERCAKLRERAVAMLSELRGVVSEGDYDSPSGRYFLLRKDVAAYEDALRELGVEL